MRKIEVNFKDYRNGATSAIDTIEVEDGYTPEDYITDCEINGVDVEDYRENGEIIFVEI